MEEHLPLAALRPPRTANFKRGGGTFRRPIVSPLTRRILAVNLAAPVLLVLGLLFLDRYADTLIATELDALRIQGDLIAASIGEGAVVVDTENADFPVYTPNGAVRIIDQDSAKPLVRRLAVLAAVHARLFDRNGAMIVDSQLLQGPGGVVQVIDLAPATSIVTRVLRRVYNATIGHFSYERRLQPYQESASPSATDYPEVGHALETGESASALRRRADGQKVLLVAVPVQFYKQVVGAVLVSRNGHDIDERLFSVRRSILSMFAWVLGLTVLTSVYLAGTIARPVRRLAQAAESVRSSKRRQHTIPDLTHRSDEIGDLSAALRDMTDSLWSRMDAIERFAADVAHEIKNPLTSLRSAVETVARLKDPEQQKRLLAIIVDDVGRLDRLISDISDASRLDAELSRAELGAVRLLPLLRALADVQNATDSVEAPRAQIIVGDGSAPSPTAEPSDIPAADADQFVVPGLEGRLGQVFRNLIGNAVSFSPPGGTITIRITRMGQRVEIAFEDRGPGLPAGKERAIFERFYSERPEGEKFGTHSGLGLSISKQIIDAHQGVIYAENVVDADGAVRGARFVVRLPAA
ncbi:MAG: HAMP domain-containing protein [Rhodospirillaceae bacterium]|nr:MAG: HAMP domain-containing protein [Rhodospirillaceae bacterium]